MLLHIFQEKKGLTLESLELEREVKMAVK